MYQRPKYPTSYLLWELKLHFRVIFPCECPWSTSYTFIVWKPHKPETMHRIGIWIRSRKQGFDFNFVSEFDLKVLVLIGIWSFASSFLFEFDLEFCSWKTSKNLFTNLFARVYKFSDSVMKIKMTILSQDMSYTANA